MIPEQLSEISLSLSVRVYCSTNGHEDWGGGWHIKVCISVRTCVCMSAVKVNSAVSDLFMSCGAIINFSTGLAWNNLHYTLLYLCAYVCRNMCLCVRPITVNQKLFFFLLPQLPHSLSFFPPPPAFYFSRSPLFFLLESLLAQEPHLFMLLGLRCHFQIVAKKSFLKINRVDKLKKIN